MPVQGTGDGHALSELLRQVLTQPGGVGPLALSDDGKRLCAPDGSTVAALRDGVVDFVSPDHDDRGDMKGFGYQWRKVVAEPLAEATIYGKRYAEIRADLLTDLGLVAEQIRGLKALDAGCGHGLYDRALASLGADVIGTDLSESVYLCAAQHARVPQPGTQAFVRADVLNFPFTQGAFDVVLCLGMAMCTPDPRQAVLNAARCVAPGGRFLLYVYERGAVGYVTLRERFALPHYLPVPVLHLFCRLLAVPLCLYLAIRGRRRPTWRSYKNAGLGLFDAYSPTYLSTHEPEEIMGWVREAGYDDVRRLTRCLYLAIQPGRPGSV